MAFMDSTGTLIRIVAFGFGLCSGLTRIVINVATFAFNLRFFILIVTPGAKFAFATRFDQKFSFVASGNVAVGRLSGTWFACCETGWAVLALFMDATVSVGSLDARAALAILHELLAVRTIV